jgi:aspartate/methionine/tyrosine aminotransferase
VADLFADRDTDVVVPNPSWGNYKAIFRMRREANIVRWKYFDATSGLNIPAFRDALGQVRTKGIVVLNFPGNPTGYTPTPAEAKEMVGVLAAHRGAPLVVVFDDAYQGFYHEDSVHRRSLFWDLLESPNPDRILPVKIDGATKEFAFFGGRVGFLTFGADEATGEALNDKAIAISRATVSALPGPSQQVLLAALQHPDLEHQLLDLRRELTSRYRILQEALTRLEGSPLTPYPFNSGCFALLNVGGGLDAGDLRKRLLNDQSVGLVSIADVNALRIAYCSMAPEDISPMVERIRSTVISAA